MGKEKQNNSRKTKIILILLIIIFILLLSFNVFIYFKTTEVKTKNKKLEKELTSLKTEVEKSNEEIKTLEKELDDLNNLETRFTELKKEYFSNIKKLEDKIISGKSNEKIAYITFDDGPYYQTLDILKTLEKYDINVTFFNIGVDKNPCFDNQNYNCQKIYKKIAEKDHTIANHTYTHSINYGLYSSTNSFINDVEKQEKLIKEKTGLVTNIVRFPGGSATAGGLKTSIIEQLRKRNYGWVDWTALDGDGVKVDSVEEAMLNIKNTVNENIEVILLHDYNTITYQALPSIIEYLQENNYLLLPLFYESNMINK